MNIGLAFRVYPKQYRKREKEKTVSLDVAGKFRYPSPDLAWLSQRVEEVLEPALPIVDAHHHLWEEGGSPYLLAEMRADVDDGHRIDATVFVQAHYGYRTGGPAHLAPVGETEKVAAISRAARDAGCATRIAQAIVAYADLMSGPLLAETLDAHGAAAEGALRGIRHSVSRDENFPDGIVLRPAPAGLLGDPAYRAGLAELGRRGLAYDAMLYHSQISELVDAAKAVPGTSIILDHLGCILGVGPYEGQEKALFANWREDMRRLADCPNVAVKIGGFGMIICGARWHERALPPSSEELADAWRPYVETCTELFGAERCMFESNFPVDKAMYSYRTLWNAFKRITQGWPEADRAMLFSETARGLYRLDQELPESVRPISEAADA